MKFKKIITSIALFGTITVLLSSCFYNESKTIRFYQTAPRNADPILEQVKKQFEKENEGWTLKLVKVPGSYGGIKDKINSELFSNKISGSLAMVYPDTIAEMLPYKKVVNLESYFKKLPQDEQNNYIDTFLKELRNISGSGEDTLYGLPFSKSAEVMFYNKTELDAIYGNSTVGTTGKVYTELLKSWDGIWQLSSDLQQKKKTTHKQYEKWVNMGVDSSDNLMVTSFVNHAWKYTDPQGHILIDPNNEGFQDMIINLKKRRGDQAMTDKIASAFNIEFVTNETLGKKYVNYIFNRPYTGKEKNIEAGGLFMSIGSTAGAGHYTKSPNVEIGISQIPAANMTDIDKTNKAVSQGPSIVMLDCGKEKNDKAWEVLKILTSKETQKKYATTTGYLPVRDLNNDEDYKKYLENNNLIAKSIKLVNEHLQSLYYTPVFNGSGVVRNEMGQLLTRILSLPGDIISKEEVKQEIKRTLKLIEEKTKHLMKR